MKWDLEEDRVVSGASDRRILRLIRTLQQEGRL
jgi:hypothetical protein